jgi:hypothetical protein
MTTFSRVAIAAALVLLAASPAAARSWITLYSAPGYQGASVDLDHPVRNLDHYNFNDRAQSIRVHGAWQLCAANDFGGECVTLTHDVPSLKGYDMNRRANSVRPLH